MISLIERTWCAFVVFSLMVTNCHASESRDEREIKLAESAIFWGLVSAKGEEGRKACAESPLACSDDRAELGLALLAAKVSPASLVAFVEVLRYRIDGALSEDFTCYALKKGRKIRTSIQEVNAEFLAVRCRDELSDAVKENPMLLSGVDPEAVCSSPVDIESRVRELSAAIRSGRKCVEGDF